MGVVFGDEANPKKKSQFLAAYPLIFKFFLFWWCVLMGLVALCFVCDYVMGDRKPAKVDWALEYVFSNAADRSVYWAQFVDPTAWSDNHPVMKSATLEMIRCLDLPHVSEKNKQPPEKDETEKKQPPEKEEIEKKPSEKKETDKGKDADEDDAFKEPTRPSEHVPLTVLEPGLGFILRHKEGDLKGKFFCTRKCYALDMPEDGVWRIGMRTVEGGDGYIPVSGTEETEIEMWPPNESGEIRCRVHSGATVLSRIQLWRSGLKQGMMAGTEAMFDAIQEEVSLKKSKK